MWPKKACKAEKKKTKQMDKIIHGSRARLPQLTEIYLELYYEEKVAPIVKDQTPVGANPSEWLMIVKRVMRELWQTVEWVHAQLAELKLEKLAKMDKPDELPCPEEIINNLDDLPAFMGRFLEWLQSTTGWSFSCLMGGPDPDLPGGDIRVCSYHVGEAPGHKDFMKFYADFGTSVMGPFTKFVNTVYPALKTVIHESSAESVRLSHAIQKDNEDLNSCSTSGPSNNTAHVGHIQKAEKFTKVGKAVEVRVEDDGGAKMSTPQSDAGTVPIESTNNNMSSAVTNINLPVDTSVGMWPGVGEFTSSLYTGSSAGAHTVDNYQVLEDENGAYDFTMGFPFDAKLPTDSVASTPPITHSSTSGIPTPPPTLLAMVPSPIKTPLAVTPSPTPITVTPAVPAPVPASISAPILTSSTMTPAPVPASPIPVPLTVPSATNTECPAAMLTNTPSGVQSRSGSKVPDGKENIHPGIVTCPDWMTAAHAHLTAQVLGDNWSGCVSAWDCFEAAMMYQSGKGLPAKSRPEEWNKWMTKTRHSYSDTSVISDPMEFGLATAKWWKGIHPPARQSSATIMPVAVAELDTESNDTWDPLQRSGPCWS
ncbi:hypothetical protein DXG01_015945 [Tephrocybe rancida]|nr:hypothetical protein DXG01_015945 [Tephrocybe rancida]